MLGCGEVWEEVWKRGSVGEGVGEVSGLQEV